MCSAWWDCRLGCARLQNHPRAPDSLTSRFRKLYCEVPELPIGMLKPVALGFWTGSGGSRSMQGLRGQRFRKGELSDQDARSLESYLLRRDPVHTDLLGAEPHREAGSGHVSHSTVTRCSEFWVFLPEMSITPQKVPTGQHTRPASSGSRFGGGAPTGRDTAELFCPEVWLERAHVLNNTFPQMRTSIRWQRQPAPPPGSGQDDTSVPAQGTGSCPGPRGPFVRTAQPALTGSFLCPAA